MPDNNRLVEIPDQPSPIIPATATENTEIVDLGTDLDAIKLQISLTEVERKKHELEVERVMLPERKNYASRLFNLSVYWLLFIAGFLLLAGLEKLKVADSVLIALITTTTANVLGLFYIVARWLFPHKNNIESKDQPKSDSTA